MPDPPFEPLNERKDRFRLVGDVPLTGCPICASDRIGRVWQLPQTRLAREARIASPGSSSDGLYLHYLPLLKVPHDIYCFDYCANCEAIFQNPKTDDHAVYARDESKVAAFRAAGAAEFEGSARGYRRHFPSGTRRVVDAACGAGQVLSLLKRDAPELDLVGLELSRPAVEFIERELRIRAHAVDLDMDDLSARVPDGWADFVIFQESFEHVRWPTTVLAKLMRMLRPGGRLHFTAQAYSADSELQIRVGEPIFVNEATLDHVVKAVGANVLEVRKDIKLRVLLEKPGGDDPLQLAGGGSALAAASRVIDVPIPSAPPPSTRPVVCDRPGVESLAAVLYDELAPVIARRVRLVGEVYSGVGEPMRRRLANGRLLGDGEIELVARIAASAKFPEVHVIGSGLGEVVFLLASAGVAASGVESDPLRAFTAGLLLRHLRADPPALRARCELLAGRFPLSPSAAGSSEVLALVTCRASDDAARFATGLAGYGAAIVDVLRFAGADPAATADLMARAGLGTATDFADLGPDGRFVLFARP